MGKQGFCAQVDQPDEKALQYGTRTMAMGLCSEDAQAGIGAFLAKPERRSDDR
jgi:hypothetical protein